VLGEVRTQRRWTIEEKRRITEETFLSGASVPRIAQRYELNANQLFQWHKLYREGRLGSRATPKLLPVTIADEPIERGIAGPGLLAHVLLSKLRIIYRCIGRQRFMRGRAWSWIFHGRDTHTLHQRLKAWLGAQSVQTRIASYFLEATYRARMESRIAQR
jgi:hypothetical protein